MNLNISNLLQTHPSTAFIHANEAFIALVIIFLLSFVFEFCRKKFMSESYKRVLRGVPSVLRWIAFFMLIITWTRIVGIPYISMRIWWFALPLFVLYYVARLWMDYRTLESKKQFFEGKVTSHDTFKKYLPTKKKKK